MEGIPIDRDELLGDPQTAMRVILDGRQSTIWTAIPAYVTSVNFTAMTVECQPTIQGVISNFDGTETMVNLPLLVDVPIIFPSAGGFTLTLPIAINDEGLVIFSSRAIDSWWQNSGIGVPVESRQHDLSDGLFIPGPKSQPNVISSISTTNAQLRSDDGTIYLELTPSGVINLVTTSGINLTGDVNITGSLVVSETVMATGEITGNGIALSTHTHSVVVPSTPFTGDTGAPI